MSLMYIVTREGVYRHEIRGVFTTLAAAKRCIKVCLKQESDSYHDYLISSIATEKTVKDSTPVYCVNGVGEEQTDLRYWK